MDDCAASFVGPKSFDIRALMCYILVKIRSDQLALLVAAWSWRDSHPVRRPAFRAKLQVNRNSRTIVASVLIGSVLLVLLVCVFALNRGRRPSPAAHFSQVNGCDGCVGICSIDRLG